MELQNKILDIIFKNDTLTNEQIDTILKCDKATLTHDLHKIIKFCDENSEDIEDDMSYNVLYYALFLLKENETDNQLTLILDILKWDDDKIDYWFGSLFTEYYWNLVCHFGQNHLRVLVDFLKRNDIETFNKEQVALALYQIFLKHPDKQEAISNYWTELLEHYNALPLNLDEIDTTYLAFFTGYIYKPTDYQTVLIKELFDKNYIDISINGDFKELLEVEEEEKKLLSVYDLNNDFVKYEDIDESEISSNFYKELFEYENNEKPYIAEVKIGRNESCPCGSGKKYKKCCLSVN